VGPRCVVGERSMCGLCAGEALESRVCCASVVVTSTVLVTISMPRACLDAVLLKDPAVCRQFEDLFDRHREEIGETSLSNVALFRECCPAFAERLDRSLKHAVLLRGSNLMTQGEASSEAALLCRGSVSIVRDGVQRSNVAVDHMKRAVIFGVQNLLGLKQERSCSVVAKGPCVLHVISADVLRKLFDDFPAESSTFRKIVEAHHDGRPHHMQARVGSWAHPRRRSSLRKSVARGYGQRKTMVLDLSQPLGALLRPRRGDSDDESESESEGEGREAECGGNKDLDGCELVPVPQDLRLVQEFRSCHWQLLEKLQRGLQPRLYMPGQVLQRQGEDLVDIFVLQRGLCEASVFGANLQPLAGPCVVGGTMAFVSPKACTTAVALETCFVAAIVKQTLAAALDEYPQDRRALFANAQEGFEQLCDSFHQHYVGLEGMERSLAALPFLVGSPSELLASLAGLVAPQLLLPGQVVIQSASQDLAADARPKLYILFGGHCHQICDGVVVGTISQKMVFGELEVFGIAESRGKNLEIRTVELCEVGSVTREQLFGVLSRFPEERWRFEQLVHGRLEGTVQPQVLGQHCFEGMPSHFLSNVCCHLDRRLCFEDTEVAREGEAGEAMFIVNRGKVEITYKGVTVSMLWAGKSFGAAQMLGLNREYHATLRSKGTCHLLALSRRALHTLAVGGTERPWMPTLRQRAQAILESELRLFERKWREHRHLLRSGAATALAGDNAEFRIAREGQAALLHLVVVAWRRSVKGRKQLAPTRRPAPAPVGKPAELEAFLGGAPPIRFSRGLRRVELEAAGEGVVSAADWRRVARSGRLDAWKTVASPGWLTAVREEIPNQLIALKQEARGEAARLPGLGGPGLR